MKYYKLVAIVIAFFFFTACKNKTSQNTVAPDSEYDKILTKRENYAAGHPIKIEGKLVSDISFEVKADEKYFENGIQPWISIEKPESELSNLKDKDIIVIPENEVTVIIDYPVNTQYTFDLKSDKGFSREMLLKEISNNYFKMYDEEEKSATIKTLPMEKRTMYNRNQTNGKYGIWGHDIADLVLTSIQVYKDKNGKIILALGVDS